MEIFVIIWINNIAMEIFKMLAFFKRNTQEVQLKDIILISLWVKVIMLGKVILIKIQIKQLNIWEIIRIYRRKCYE